MSKGNLTDIVSTAEEALNAFLATLFGDDATLRIDEPVSSNIGDAVERSASLVALTAEYVPGEHWSVLLDPSWVPALSKSVLGESSEVGDAGTDDLLKELAAQAYEAIRTRFASAEGSAKRSLPETTITMLPKGGTLNPDEFPSEMVEVSFQLPYGDQALGGFALLPAPPPAAAPAGVDVSAKGSVSAEQGSSSDAAPKSAQPAEPGRHSTSGQQTAAEPAAASGQPAPAGHAVPGAEKDLRTAEGPSAGPPPASSERQARIAVAPAAFPELGREVIGGDGSEAGFSLLAEVDLEVTVELGRRKIQLADVLRLTTGSVIELEKLVGEPLEVYANGRLIAEGEAVVMDEQFGIRITNLTSNRPRAKAFS